MKTSQAGINLIKSFEGCRLKAYKPVSTERYWTIGYGHYGADVKQGMTITQAQADSFLVADLSKFEGYVNALGKQLNQNQFDALVSFAYNCGAGNLRTLCANRTLPQIAVKLLAYNKAGGKVLSGLTRRRKEEQKLFNSPVKQTVSKVAVTGGLDYSLVFNATFYANKYPDLKKAKITTADQLLNHFITYGMKEGRQAIATFNVLAYKNKYSDLRDEYEDNLPAYYIHYITHGKSEGRKAI